MKHGRAVKATLFVCFDEARFLCDTSALTDVQIHSRHKHKSIASSEKVDADTNNFLYSNFRALRCALRYLKQGFFVPLVFGLFTDTTSRLTNFQPRSTDESTGGRVLELPRAGENQFDPICVFTSIDAHSQILKNNPAISDHQQVAKVERLLKFGRAGWYSIYSATINSATSQKPIRYNDESILNIAQGKLLGGLKQRGNLEVLMNNDESATSQWLALLACRLAITIGPFSREAEELVSSHLAILLRTDKERHFLKIYYPSEPILGEASASITSQIGWGPALKALHNHLENGIINAGYRGELLSKVLCLIAMDRIPKPFTKHNTSGYWAHTQPVKVRDFLDGWLASPNDGEYDTFSDALLHANHRTDKKELNRFLDGYVFFNHFVRLDHILSIEAIASSWNRGAAIMPKENTSSFDHVIPVMLAPRGRKKTAPEFGHLHKLWNEDQLNSACSNVSFILINSRNYTAAVSHKTAAYGCSPNKRNFENVDMFGGKNVEFVCGGQTPKTVFLSIVQGFGPRQKKEPYVNIRPRGTRTIHQRVYRQIVVVLKELGPKTYACLQQPDFPDDNSDGRFETEIDRDESMEEEDGEEDEFDLALPYDDGEEDEVETPDYGSLEDDEEELDNNSEFADVTKYLRMLRTANLGFLDDVETEDLLGVRDFLPVVYDRDRKPEAEQAEKEWDVARDNWPLRGGSVGGPS
jgi:hypothetical protein